MASGGKLNIGDCYVSPGGRESYDGDERVLGERKLSQR